MSRKTFIAGLVALFIFAVVGAATAAPPANSGCTRYNNHSGHIPSSYDFGHGEEYSNGRLIDTFTIRGGGNAGPPSNGGSWDRVWKCYDPVVTTTSSTTTTVPDTTTTTVPDTTTTTIVVTTTVPETTTTTTEPEVTTTTQPEVTTTVPEATTTVPEVTTTVVVTTTTVDPCDQEGACLPVTGAPLFVWGLLGVLLVALGVGLLKSARRET